LKLIDRSISGTRLARYWAFVGDRGYPKIGYDFTDSRRRDGAGITTEFTRPRVRCLASGTARASPPWQPAPNSKT